MWNEAKGLLSAVTLVAVVLVVSAVGYCVSAVVGGK